LKENNRIECPYLPHSWLPKLEKGFFKLKREFLGDQLKRSFRGSW
jgi:hypothetical protein